MARDDRKKFKRRGFLGGETIAQTAKRRFKENLVAAGKRREAVREASEKARMTQAVRVAEARARIRADRAIEREKAGGALRQFAQSRMAPPRRPRRAIKVARADVRRVLVKKGPKRKTKRRKAVRTQSRDDGGGGFDFDFGL